MVDLDWKSKIISSEIPGKSPRFVNKPQISIPLPRAGIEELAPASDAACSAYEQYLRLPELRRLWGLNEFPGWRSEAVLRPAMMALEITFRFISAGVSDPRPYVNRREWRRRLEALVESEVDLVAWICEDDEEDVETRGTIPILDLTSDGSAVARKNSSVEVWKMADDTVVVSPVSEESILPKLATWEKTEEVAKKIQLCIECRMNSCPFTLGLGEPNLSGKPSVNFDLICRPSELHALKKCPNDDVEAKNLENRSVYSTHQILESWIRVAKELIVRISDEIDGERYDRAAGDCWILEKVWKIMAQIEDLHMLMDPDDFLKLKNQLMIRASSQSDLFCFRSRDLVEITKSSKNLKHKVPAVLGVEVDPTGGPRVQDAAMELYRRKEDSSKIHLLQAMQAVESAVKGFFFSYKQLLTALMGSLEANSGGSESGDLLGQIFLEPTYFPSLDAAKTFLGERWSRGGVRRSPELRRRRNGHI